MLAAMPFLVAGQTKEFGSLQVLGRGVLRGVFANRSTLSINTQAVFGPA